MTERPRPQFEKEHARISTQLESPFYTFLNNHPLTDKKITEFLNGTQERFSSEQARYIERALVLATEAHQYNETEEKRYRKTKNPDGSPIPYIEHPLSVAQRLMADDFDWPTVAAALLHDVPEDVQISGKASSRQEWFRIIEETFEDTGMGQELAHIVYGVTEVKASNNPKEIASLKSSPIYKMIFSYMEKGGITGSVQKNYSYIDKETEQNILDIVASLHHTFNIALEDPFMWRTLVLKIGDIWENLQTPEYVKEEKVLRGRIAANLAEWMGWYPMSDELVRELAQVSDTINPFVPNTEKDVLPFKPERHEDKAKQTLFDCCKDFEYIYIKMLEQWAEQKKAMKDPCIITKGDKYPLYYDGFFLPSSPDQTSRLRLNGKESTLPTPRLILIANKPIQDYFTFLRSGTGNTGKIGCNIHSDTNIKKTTRATLFSTSTLSSQIKDILGRTNYEYRVDVGNKQGFRLTIEENKPHIIDTLTRPNLRKESTPIALSQIPEVALLAPQTMPLLSDTTRQRHIDGLIAFFYDPHAIQYHSFTTPLFIRERNELVFVYGKQEVGTVCDELRIPIDPETRIQPYYLPRKEKGGIMENLSFRLLAFQRKYAKTFFSRLIIIE